MRLPVIQGVIDRRILVNFRVDPVVLQRVLPAPFRPKLVNGHGVAGICLIRFRHLRPRHLPAMIGLSSENAAHRIAVEWDSDGVTREGVFIARRDSNSVLNTLAGGKLFPGVHHHANFTVAETENSTRIEIQSDDGQVRVLVEAELSDSLPENSVFGSLDNASKFFEAGSIGYSPTGDASDQSFEGMELKCMGWKVQPLAMKSVESSFFGNESLFRPGSVEFDCALIMRGIEHEWHDHGKLGAIAAAGKAK
jgi:hypothetical protein